MFHVIVKNSAGHMVSLTRHSVTLCSSITDCMPLHRMTTQEFWDEYCRRYKIAFGKDFPPDVKDATY